MDGLARVLAIAVTIIAIPAVELSAQAEKLAGRFPPAAEAALRALLDSARTRGPPVAPLTQRALEGASRGVPPDRVVAAVRGLSSRLASARAVLGDAATEPELVAAASALYAGVAPNVLGDLRHAEPQRNLSLRLVVLTDMIDRGVPKDTASAVILSLSAAGVSDESYQSLRQSILLDIRSGMAPTAAASTRARGVLIQQRSVPRPGGVPPPKPPSP